MRLLILFIIFFSSNSISREAGQTEITTDQGIEVFQNEKFYLLKKNVKIISDDFELNADLVKGYFDKDLYDIIKIESEGNVTLLSNQGMKAKGQKVNFSTKNENINVLGKGSSLDYDNIEMFSDGLIKVNNLTGKFKLEGDSSELKTDEILIIGNTIDGQYKNINGINEIVNLEVQDYNLANIQTNNLNMFANKAIYNKKDNIIELFENVKVIRDNEIITGDYANIDTLNESYKIKSKDSEKKVKILLNKINE